MIGGTGRRLIALAATAMLAASCGSAPPAPSVDQGLASASPSVAPSGGQGSAATEAPVTPLRWSDCGNGFECGSLPVPRDYAHPGVASLLLAVIRRPALDPAHRIGSLLVNPGGPGESGVDFVRDSSEGVFPEEIRKRFDVVGFDPRGVNRSSDVRCVDNLEHFLALDSTPDTPAELNDLLTGEQAFVKGCQRRNADLLPFVGTANVVKDLDRLRASLGDTKLTYIGFSYGTLIGSLYAQAYPSRIRAMVLDGVVDPTLDLAHLSLGQAVAFEGALKRWLAYCGQDATCAFHHGGRPGPALETLMRRIEAKPLRATRINDARPVGPSYAWEAVLGSLYARDFWPVLGQALDLAERGDGSILLLLSDPLNGRNADGGYSNLIDANRAVTCLDFAGPRDPAPYIAEAKAWARLAPHFGALVAFSNIDCAFWPVPPARRPGPVDAPGAPPIVVIGSTGDPATPYQWAVSLAHQLSSAVLITRQGEGHTGYAFSRCVQDATDSYLIDLTVKAGTVCKS